jgi:hypothetical protein
MEVYDPEKNNTTAIRNNVIFGTREYKYVMIPQREGAYNIPSPKFVYFDTDSKTLKTLETKSFSIRVTPGKVIASSIPRSSMQSRQEIKMLGQDIRFIKTGSIKMISARPPLHRSKGFVALQFIPLFLLGGSLLYQRQRRRLTEDVGYARRVRSKKQVRKRLAEAKMHLSKNQPGAFYGALSKGMTDYIGDLLNLSATGMTIDAICVNLQNAGMNTDQCGETISLLEKADFARFATATITGEEMAHDMEKAENLLNAIDFKKIKK